MVTVPTNASGVTVAPGEPGVVGVVGVHGLLGVVGETGQRVPLPSTGHLCTGFNGYRRDGYMFRVHWSVDR